MERLKGHPTGRDESSPNASREVRAGEVLYDRHRREYYRVDSVEPTGIALYQDGTDFYIPHSLFVSWYGRRLFAIDGIGSIEVPEWC